MSSVPTPLVEERPGADHPIPLATGETAGIPAPRTRAVAGWMIASIHAYQGLRSGRPTGCRFLPTCSEYAVQAIERHGAARGTALATRRLAHCHPWGGHGVDPVPEGRVPCSPH